MITSPRPQGFRDWTDFPGLEKLPTGTVVSKGKWKGLDLVYFYNGFEQIGFSIMASKANDIDSILAHWKGLSEM